MSELIGKIFLGSTFVQDAKWNYIKIDSVLLGESSKYGYKSVNNGDIGKLLDDCLKDGKAAVILYDWNKKVGYIKSGFDLSDSSDSKQQTGFTTFIVKSKIGKGNLEYFSKTPEAEPEPTTEPMPEPEPITPGKIRVNEFVRLGESDRTVLELNGFRFVPVGWNSFFLGLMQETMRYPTKPQVTEIFEAARKLKATVVRSHTLGFSAENNMTLIDKNNKFNKDAWDIIDFAYKEAKRCSIKLIPVLCDPYEYYHGSLKTFCEPYGVSKEQFFTHETPRKEFKKYITEYLNHVNPYTGVAIKNALEVAFIEIGNELGNIRPNAGSTAIPTRDWIVDITKHIKSIDKNHLVLNGSDECLGSSQSNDFTVKEMDVFQSHFYWKDWNRLRNDAKRAAEVGRPYIVGEYDSGWGDDWFKEIEKTPNMRGSMSWSMYPHEDGKPTGNRMQHDDGFTFWYDKQSDENTRKLLNMTNHFRRMQKLPEISSIKF